MILGKVIGTVWGAKQSDGLVSRKIVEVRRVSLKGMHPGDCFTDDVEGQMLSATTLLAVDPLGADVGQLVVVAIGSRVRDLAVGPAVTTKNAVIAIVDEAAIES